MRTISVVVSQLTTHSRLCFINPDGVDVTPYFAQYLGCINSDYDVVFWNRTGRGRFDVPGVSNVYEYKKIVKSGSASISLAIGYCGFRSFATKILSEKNYDRVVALTGNTAAILNRVLSEKYAGRYIVDVRDYFLENFTPYLRMEQRAIERSGLTIISSPDYRSFLGEHDYLVMHNDQMIPEADRDHFRNAKHPSQPFILTSLGTAKNLKADRKLVDFFAGDERFKLRLIGRGYEQLADYVRDLGINNVEIGGAFPSEDTFGLYRGTDAVVAMYGFGHPHFDHMLANKLYVAARLGVPVVVSPNTYMASVVEEHDLGIVLNLDRPREKERLLSVYDEPTIGKYKRGMSSFLEMVESENRSTRAAITSFLSE